MAGNWSGGVVPGGGTLTNTGFLNFVSSTGNRPLAMVNEGTVTITGTSNIPLQGFVNDATGVLDLQSDAGLTIAGFCPQHALLTRRGNYQRPANQPDQHRNALLSGWRNNFHNGKRGECVRGLPHGRWARRDD
jgi:hypothetical protein